MRAALLFVLVGCGRFGFDPSVRADAAAAADATRVTDTGDGAVGNFGTAVRMSDLDTTAREITPTLRADQLEIIFNSDRDPMATLWDATRTATDQPYAAATPVTIPGISAAEEPALSGDGLTLLFEDGDNSAAITVTTRATTSDSWGATTVVGELDNYYAPAFIDDLQLVMADANGYLFEASRPTTGDPWTIVRRYDELYVPGAACTYPTERADGLEVIFEFLVGTTHTLMRATRPTLADPFGPAELLDFGFTGLIVGDPELSRDGHTLVFTVQIGGTDYDLYAATR